MRKRKLKTAEYFRRRKIIIEREEKENTEICAAVIVILGRLIEQKHISLAHEFEAEN